MSFNLVHWHTARHTKRASGVRQSSHLAAPVGQYREKVWAYSKLPVSIILPLDSNQTTNPLTRKTDCARPAARSVLLLSRILSSTGSANTWRTIHRTYSQFCRRPCELQFPGVHTIPHMRPSHSKQRTAGVHTGCLKAPPFMMRYVEVQLAYYVLRTPIEIATSVLCA